MIQNNWKRMLDKADIKQNSLAERAGINKGVLSMVVQGERILPMDKLETCLSLLDCTLGDIYNARIQRVIYGVAPRPRSATVSLDANVVLALDELIEQGIYNSRKEAANALLRSVTKRCGDSYAQV